MAARYLGQPGSAPNDVDVLVIGDVAVHQQRIERLAIGDECPADVPIHPYNRRSPTETGGSNDTVTCAWGRRALELLRVLRMWFSEHLFKRDMTATLDQAERR